MGVPDPQGKGRFGGLTPRQNMQLQIADKPLVLCCHLANTKEELGGLSTPIPPFAKLLWALLLLLLCCYNYQQCYFDSLCIHYVDAWVILFISFFYQFLKDVMSVEWLLFHEYRHKIKSVFSYLFKSVVIFMWWSLCRVAVCMCCRYISLISNLEVCLHCHESNSLRKSLIYTEK